MQRPPRRRSEGIIRGSMLARAWLFLGLIAAALQMGAFFYVLTRAGWSPGDPTGDGAPLHHAYEQATTMTFLSMVVAQIGTAFAARTERASLRSIGVFSNRLLLWGIAFELALAAVLIYVPVFQDLLGTAALPAKYLLLVVPFPFIVWGADELRRWLIRRARRKPAPPPRRAARRGPRSAARRSRRAFLSLRRSGRPPRASARSTAAGSSASRSSAGVTIPGIRSSLASRPDVHGNRLGGDDEKIGVEAAGEQRGREVLVDDGLDPVHRAVAVERDRDPAATGADQKRAGVDQGPQAPQLDDRPAARARAGGGGTHRPAVPCSSRAGRQAARPPPRSRSGPIGLEGESKAGSSGADDDLGVDGHQIAIGERIAQRQLEHLAGDATRPVARCRG